MLRFKEIRKAERNLDLGFDPDKLVGYNEDGNEDRDEFDFDFDPDKLIEPVI